MDALLIAAVSLAIGRVLWPLITARPSLQIHHPSRAVELQEQQIAGRQIAEAARLSSPAVKGFERPIIGTPSTRAILRDLHHRGFQEPEDRERDLRAAVLPFAPERLHTRKAVR